MRKEIYVAALQACVFLFCGVAFAQPFSNHFSREFYNRNYDYVRMKLVRLGYEPVMIHHKATDTVCDLQKMCGQYREVLDCSNTGLSYCYFVFRAPESKRYVIVTTHGEIRRIFESLAPANKSDLVMIGQH